ncbi:Uncharacterized protein Adt_40771 [Abeliophyllum distichum]|uniref:Uncharacterized protein n=1 Tax=Abeliophyllum distichum TaxID=126358 RepID=A0ABD1PM10_9LAMI
MNFPFLQFNETPLKTQNSNPGTTPSDQHRNSGTGLSHRLWKKQRQIVGNPTFNLSQMGLKKPKSSGLRIMAQALRRGAHRPGVERPDRMEMRRENPKWKRFGYFNVTD